MFRALAIDDEPMILDSYKLMYQQEDEIYSALTALAPELASHASNLLDGRLEVTVSGEAGFNMVKQSLEKDDPYAVIYLDMRMPGGWGGAETARAIREIDPDVRIVVVTAYSDTVVDDLAAVIGDGFVYNSKPYDFDQLKQLTRFMVADWLRLKELNVAKEQAESLSGAKNNFLAMMSHELRTPLTSLMGYQEMVADLLPANQHTVVDSMSSASRQMLNLVNDLMDASQINSNVLEIEREPFQLMPMLSEMEARFKERSDESHLGFVLNNETTLDHFLIGDESRLRQILNTLLGNAFKFTEQGEVSLQVSEPQQGLYHFVVSDTGRGIPAAQQSTVFDSFEQADQSLSREHCGMGLGLHIAKGLAQLMGGDISLQSEEGKGSQFTLQIPLQKGRPLLPQKREVDSNKRILVVDDAQPFLNYISSLAAQWGLEVTTAEDGVKGVEAAEAGDFDLIIMDHLMPEMDGLTAANHLRGKNDLTPIILVSGEVTKGLRARAIAAGVDAVMNKPLPEKKVYLMLQLYNLC